MKQFGSGVLCWLLLLALCHVLPTKAQTQKGMNISSTLDTLLHGYDKRVRPNYGGKPVEVGITMYILQISSVSEVDMEYTMDVYFRQKWTDPRLSISWDNQWDNTISLGETVLDQIWIPDTFFPNEKRAYFHQATTSNLFLRISPSGEVFTSRRLSLTAACPMDLQYFPMDNQKCVLDIESFGYTAKDILYFWQKETNSVGISPEVELPQFVIKGHNLKTSSVSLSSGNYSRMTLEIQFHRHLGFYLLQLYIPSSFVVIISWVSFWLNRNASPARVSIGVTTVLTMTMLMTSTTTTLPKVSYVKSVDVYLGTCFVLVLAALIEYAFVGYTSRGDQKDKYPDKKNPELLMKDSLMSTNSIDKYARIVFPVLFLSFNILYWIVYMQLSDNSDHSFIPLHKE